MEYGSLNQSTAFPVPLRGAVGYRYPGAADDSGRKDQKSLAVVCRLSKRRLGVAMAIEESDSDQHDSGPEASLAENGPERWMTSAQAAEYSSVSEETIRKWVRSGHVHAGRAGRALRIRASALDAYLERPAGSVGPRPQMSTSQRALELLRDGEDGSKRG